MKKTTVLLFLTILVCFTGCEDKKPSETFIDKDNNTHQTVAQTFTVTNKKQTQKITLLNQTLTFHNIQTPVVMITLFEHTCTPCISQIKSFKTLEQKYQNKLSIISLFKKSDAKDNIKFAHAIYHSLDIHTSLPLSIIYKHGKYYSHFEGVTPVEMITYDIQQAIQN